VGTFLIGGFMKNFYFVYWKQGTRKALVKGKDEEEAIKEARRFAGEYTKISKVELLNIKSED
jgi:hypothetical protein